MSAAAIDLPSVTVLTSTGGAVAPNSITAATGVTVEVEDSRSGPGRLEVTVLAGSGGARTVSNSDYIDDTQVLYTSTRAGLGDLGSLPAGQVYLRAIDQAGNISTFSFLSPLPLVSVGGGRGAVRQKAVGSSVKVWAGEALIAQWIEPCVNIRVSDTRFFRTVLPDINDFRKVVTPSRDLSAAEGRFEKFNPIYCRLRCRDGVIERTYRVTNSRRQIERRILTLFRRETDGFAVRSGSLFARGYLPARPGTARSARLTAEKAARGVGRSGKRALYV